MLSVILHGCSGHMGHVVASLIRPMADVQIVCGVDRTAPQDDLGFPVFTSLDEVQVSSDVVIDFSTAAAVSPLIRWCVEQKKPVVLCTTGLSDPQKEELVQASKQIPVFFSANMSLGINLLSALASKAAQILSPAGFDIEIEERHHRRKLDAPSGTALMIAEAMTRSLDDGHYIDTGRMDRREARHPRSIGISAVRGGTIVGEHTVLFAGQDELIELKHTALSRDVFAVGAINAARFLANRAPGLYDMNDLLNL